MNDHRPGRFLDSLIRSQIDGDIFNGFGYIDNRWVAGKLELYQSLGTADADAIYTEVHGRLLCNITKGTVGKSISVMAGDEYGVIVMQEGPFQVTVIG